MRSAAERNAGARGWRDLLGSAVLAVSLGTLAVAGVLSGCSRTKPGPEVPFGGATLRAPSGWTLGEQKRTDELERVQLAAPGGRVTCQLTRVRNGGTPEELQRYLDQSREYFTAKSARDVSLSGQEGRALKGVLFENPKVYADDGEANASVQVMGAVVDGDLLSVIATTLDATPEAAAERSRCIGLVIDALEAPKTAPAQR